MSCECSSFAYFFLILSPKKNSLEHVSEYLWNMWGFWGHHSVQVTEPPSGIPWQSFRKQGQDGKQGHLAMSTEWVDQGLPSWQPWPTSSLSRCLSLGNVSLLDTSSLYLSRAHASGRDVFIEAQWSTLRSTDLFINSRMQSRLWKKRNKRKKTPPPANGFSFTREPKWIRTDYKKHSGNICHRSLDTVSLPLAAFWSSPVLMISVLFFCLCVVHSHFCKLNMQRGTMCIGGDCVCVSVWCWEGGWVEGGSLILGRK